MDSQEILRHSFLENFNDDSTDLSYFEETFIKIADVLGKLTIKECFVDVSRKEKLIDFNLVLEDGFFLSVRANVGDTTDELMYSIAKDHNTIIISVDSLNEIFENTNLLIRGLYLQVADKVSRSGY